MSADRVDLIEGSYRAFREDDVGTLLSLYHPEAVWDNTRWEGVPETQVYRGVAGVEEVLRMLRDVFRDLDVRPEEIREVDENRMWVKGSIRIRGRASGVELDAPPFAQIIEFRDDLIVRVEGFSDVEAARQAAGLAGPQPRGRMPPMRDESVRSR